MSRQNLRWNQWLLSGSTLLASWMGLQAVHEFGHVVGAWVSGGVVEHVELHPLAISRTDLAKNPHPRLVVWAGPLLGTLLPLAAWLIALAGRCRGAFLLRFFAAFCLVGNGVYIAVGSLSGIGDSGDMLRHGSPAWLLWLFGVVTVPAGLLLWHGQGVHFGLGAEHRPVPQTIVWLTASTAISLILLGIAVSAWQ